MPTPANGLLPKWRPSRNWLTRNVVRLMLDRLGEKKRDVFVLHDLEGVAPAEIAQIVGAPVLTVRTRLFYARRELEVMLGEEPALASVREALSAKGGGDASETGKVVGS